MSLGSTLFAAFGSDKPDLRKIEIVKNVPIQEQVDRGITANKGLMDISDESLENFLTQFRSNTPRMEQYVNQGVGEVNDIYSGRMDLQLGALRDARRAARMDATNRALDRITAADKGFAARAGMPGRSSYRDLMKARLMRDTEIDAGLEDTAQQRADYLFGLQQRMGNLGTRQGLLQTLEQRHGTDVQRAGAIRGVPLQNLAALEQLDQANKWYGLYRKRGGLERFADADDESLNTIGQVAGIAGNVMSMAAVCWVAREVYGVNDRRWKFFRAWLLHFAPSWFFNLYARNGEAFAKFIHDKPVLKAVIRRWMDARIREVHHV